MSPDEFSNFWRKGGEKVEGLSAQTLAFMTEIWWRTQHCKLQVIRRNDWSLKIIWNLECSAKSRLIKCVHGRQKQIKKLIQRATR
jgi:hypothetical protein